MKKLTIACGVCVVWVSVALAAAAHAQASTPSAITVRGRADVVVSGAQVRLADLAEVASPNIQDDGAVIDLKNTVVAQSPSTGNQLTLEGRAVVERLRERGFDLASLRYTLPPSITVTRAFREVNPAELEEVVRSHFERGNTSVSLKQLLVDRAVRIPADSTGVRVVSAEPITTALYGLELKAESLSEDLRFKVRATVDHWSTVAVATRPLKRGDVVRGSDVELRPMKQHGARRDVVENLGDLVGRQLTRDVGEAEIFSVHAVIIPPVVARGTKVTMVYRHGRLEATASGIALESGPAGAEIKVRNDGSQRVVSAVVVEAGLVEVGGKQG
jgi:flagella basal body P-ring formation protein FlgA